MTLDRSGVICSAEIAMSASSSRMLFTSPFQLPSCCRANDHKNQLLTPIFGYYQKPARTVHGSSTNDYNNRTFYGIVVIHCAVSLKIFAANICVGLAHWPKRIQKYSRGRENFVTVSNTFFNVHVRFSPFSRSLLFEAERLEWVSGV